MEDQTESQDLTRLTTQVETGQLLKAENVLGFLQNIIIVFVVVFGIAYLNYLLVRFWFIGDFSQNMGSIEISYIQMAKFWSENGSGWQPQWYLGHPWSVFYTPVLPALELFLHNLLGFSFGHAYRVITGTAYIFVPVSLFFFVWQVSKSKSGAMVAALFYSFLPSVMAFIASGIANDTLSAGLEPRRFAILVRWGEGPHTLSLVFIPLFGFFLSRYFERRGFVDLLLTSIFLALCALTNAIALWVAGILVFSMVLAELIEGKSEFISVFKNVLYLGFMTFGLIAFWYNLQFMSTFFSEGSDALNNWLALIPWGFLVMIFIFGVSFLLLKKFARKIVGLPFAIYWFVIIFGIVYVYYASGDSRLEYAPQALRLNTEADMALALLFGVLVSRLFLWVSAFGKGALKYVTVTFASIIFIIPAGFIIFFGMDLIARLPKYTESISKSQIQAVENTPEFRVSQKLWELTRGTDQRVLAPGNYGFWLNYFVPTPQLRGALFQSSTNFWPDHFYWQLTFGSDPQIGLALLKIANIGKLVYTGVGSGEIYKDYKMDERKFSNVMTKVGEDRGDVYYSVPLANDSMAKLVKVDEIKSIKKAKNAIDSGPIFAYVSAIEKNADKKIDFERISDSKYKISGEVGEGEGVLVQQTYDAGWKVRGGDFRKFKDSFDFLVLVPKNPGKFNVELVYSKPFGVYLGYILTVFTLGFIVKRLFNIKIPFRKSGSQVAGA
ncbi:hypothetical protein A2870_01670 [Candidatus Curtissbacteria bacterium RIFCSPHIGHO2_01_FULL_41_11]|uniref:Membrane protein 6-pyruvoyl-tetrahydropterin synthase-related domain-containing protein n=1 Tax=Candidatus Curtissbacteria bacterium RIFCSPHIGHO2_01_FULL_41_11 TaxID=1797711 RepID=A0A1F5G362_9BACT|nr:MAG: hypothetical protein A2870_01670 [Candidatus Curtissbacteria bacterium RIFCSPHIGHO2_01_FULL_41_11]